MTIVLIHADNLELRTVTENELDAIFAVYRQNEDFLALGPESKTSIDTVLKDIKTSRDESGCFCGIYQTDGSMVGVVDFVPENFEGENGVSFISFLMIAAPFRNQGLGTKVIDMVEEKIVNNFHSKTIHVAVQTDNQKALRFWKQLGYEIFQGPELRPDKTTVYYLRKKLVK